MKRKREKISNFRRIEKNRKFKNTKLQHVTKKENTQKASFLLYCNIINYDIKRKGEEKDFRRKTIIYNRFNGAET